MTQLSYIWDTGGGGDASPHSEAQTANLYKAVFEALSANKGVVPGLLNELACTISGTNLVTNTGYAIVDGHPYYNDASLNTAITTPSVGTTGRRGVLRCSWSAQTVRVTIISSADGTATVPAMTQTPGTTYDIPLCSFTTTTGGVSTITSDDREFCGLSSTDRTVIDVRAGINGRRLLSLATAQGIITATDSELLGVGTALRLSAGTISVGHVTGEPSIQFNHEGASQQGIGAFGNASLYPNLSPRMITRLIPAGSDVDLTVWQAGFSDSAASATSNGAYLRAVTTGNLFFVTRQGGAETVTNLGARSASLTTYEIYTNDAGVTWICRNATTGTIVATHTTNVPTVNVGLYSIFYHGYCSTTAGASGQWTWGQVDAKLPV